MAFKRSGVRLPLGPPNESKALQRCRAFFCLSPNLLQNDGWLNHKGLHKSADVNIKERLSKGVSFYKIQIVLYGHKDNLEYNLKENYPKSLSSPSKWKVAPALTIINYYGNLYIYGRRLVSQTRCLLYVFTLFTIKLHVEKKRWRRRR